MNIAVIVFSSFPLHPLATSYTFPVLCEVTIMNKQSALLAVYLFIFCTPRPARIFALCSIAKFDASLHHSIIVSKEQTEDI